MDGEKSNPESLNKPRRELGQPRYTHEEIRRFEREEKLARMDHDLDIRSGRSYTISGQLEELTDQISKLMAIVRELEDRLDPVLLPVPVNPEEADDLASAPNGSSISVNLGGRVSDVKEIQRRIVMLSGRIHL